MDCCSKRRVSAASGNGMVPLAKEEKTWPKRIHSMARGDHCHWKGGKPWELAWLA